MKINYYCYCVEDLGSRTKYLADIKPFVQALTSWNCMRIVNSVTRAGENLYLIPVSTNYYLFVQTKSNEVIKKIETQANAIRASEVFSLLNNNESLGFASYLYFDSSRFLFAFASRLLSPKITALQDFFNQIFIMLDKRHLSFVVEPMKTSTNKDTAMTMPFIGRTRIMVSSENSLFRHIQDILCGQANDRDIIDEIEVIIKPKPRQDIRQSMAQTLRNVENTGLEGIIMRAKENVEDQLKDIYISTTGAIFDEVASAEEGDVLVRMQFGLANNQTLQTKVNDYEQAEFFTRENIEDISHYYNAANWPRL